MLGRIDHVGVAVEDIDGALAALPRPLGMPLAHRETVEQQGVDAALLDVGEGHVELLAPLGPDTPVGKYLAKRGPGIHHVAYAVEDIDAELERLREAGLRLIDETPRSGHPQLPRGVPAPGGGRRRADRDRPAGGGDH